MLRENSCKHRWSVPALWKVGVFNKCAGEGLHGRVQGREEPAAASWGQDPAMLGSESTG